MKKFVIRWWNSEIARFKRHPYFWTIYTVVVLALNWEIISNLYQEIVEIDPRIPTEE